MTALKKSKALLDAEWLEIQAAQAEPARFKTLYERYYPNVFRFILRRTADTTLTADLSSQVFLKAMHHLAEYTYKGVPFSAWLFRIASNELAQHYRSLQKIRVVSIEDYAITHIIDEINDEHQAFYHQLLAKALNLLSEDELLLIELRFFEQRPFKEIADILNISENNAKVKTYRLLDKVKQFILKEDID